MSVCLFVWLNKTPTVKPLRRFHSWRLSFNQDGFAFSTKTSESTPSPAKVGIVHKLTGWFGFQGQQTMLTSQEGVFRTQSIQHWSPPLPRLCITTQS